MASGFQFDQQSVARISKAVKGFERNGPPADGGGQSKTAGILTPFWVQLSTEDSSNPGHYQWKMQTRANGTFTAASTALEGVTQDTTYYSAREVNGMPGLKGMYVEIRFDGYDSNNSNSPLYVFTVIDAGTFIATLTKDGGADGNATSGTAATWTYTIARNGVTLAKNVPVQKTRSLGVDTTPASMGLVVVVPGGSGGGTLASSGSSGGSGGSQPYYLWDTNETFGQQTDCTPPASGSGS